MGRHPLTKSILSEKRIIVKPLGVSHFKYNEVAGALPELALALPSQVPNQPVRVESVLGRHAPAHDGIEEGFPLASVEPQDLVKGDKQL